MRFAHISNRLLAKLLLLTAGLLILAAAAALPVRADGGGPIFTATITPTLTLIPLPTNTPQPNAGQEPYIGPDTGQTMLIPTEIPLPDAAANAQPAQGKTSSLALLALAAVIIIPILFVAYIFLRRRR